MTRAFIGLGSNQGDSHELLDRALAELAEFARRERERFEDVAAAHRQRLARPALLLQGASPFAKTPRPMPSPAGSLQERLRAVQQKFGSASDARVSSIGARR